MNRTVILFLCTWAWVAPLALAAPPPPGHAVDMGVGDLDPLSVSYRRVQIGLRSIGEQSNLFQMVQPNADRPTYERIGPGFRAQVDRMDYLVRIDRRTLATNIAPRRDGEFREIIPANTVFNLQPQNPARAVSSPLPLPAPSPYMIQAQIEARIDGRINAQVR